MKLPLCSVFFIVLLASSFADDRADALKIRVNCIPVPARRAIMLSVSNTGDVPVVLTSQIIVTHADLAVAHDVPKPRTNASDVVQIFVEFTGNAGGSLPAPFSLGAGNEPVKIDPGKESHASIPMGDDLIAFAKIPGVITWCRVRYHGRLLAEVACNDKAQIISRLEPDRGILTTFTYDDTGKRNGEQISVPDDPELHALLAAKEKELLERIQAAGSNQGMLDDVLIDMATFYTAQSLEFDKAANLQFALKNPDEIYNLKLTLAINTSKTYGEMNKKLEELIQLFPDKKKYTENFIRK